MDFFSGTYFSLFHSEILYFWQYVLKGQMKQKANKHHHKRWLSDRATRLFCSPFSPNFADNPTSLKINKQTNAIVLNFRPKLAKFTNFVLKLRTIAFIDLLISKLFGFNVELGENGSNFERYLRFANKFSAMQVLWKTIFSL